MKVLGGAAKPEAGFKMDEKHYEQAVRYALSIPGLSVAVMGLENVAELERAASVVSNSAPLSPEESQELARIGLQLAATPAWKTAYGEPLA
jgi:predicted aldo/keto reductase-like oxidoreductase